ncbi:hypothetical protein PAECIP111891_03080 [Paenibacillus allorhizoplanae]|uniref:Uncharacterized protein n=1 Tax=Paenibacillus allorhizoplanae TaxID=2905648 RepID=A0ABM9CAU1_9BACL|nr:hypothetical protein PAECIP111891_03080 [Paenibacillus allorhizoplanae]
MGGKNVLYKERYSINPPRSYYREHFTYNYSL